MSKFSDMSTTSTSSTAVDTAVTSQVVVSHANPDTNTAASNSEQPSSPVIPAFAFNSLEKVRNRLIDLSRNNRLINFKANATIPVIDHSLQHIYTKFANPSKTINVKTTARLTLKDLYQYLVWLEKHPEQASCYGLSVNAAGKLQFDVSCAPWVIPSFTTLVASANEQPIVKTQRAKLDIGMRNERVQELVDALDASCDLESNEVTSLPMTIATSHPTATLAVDASDEVDDELDSDFEEDGEATVTEPETANDTLATEGLLGVDHTIYPDTATNRAMLTLLQQIEQKLSFKGLDEAGSSTYEQLATIVTEYFNLQAELEFDVDTYKASLTNNFMRPFTNGLTATAPLVLKLLIVNPRARLRFLHHRDTREAITADLERCINPQSYQQYLYGLQTLSLGLVDATQAPATAITTATATALTDEETSSSLSNSAAMSSDRNSGDAPAVQLSLVEVLEEASDDSASTTCNEVLAATLQEIYYSSNTKLQLPTHKNSIYLVGQEVKIATPLANFVTNNQKALREMGAGILYLSLGILEYPDSDKGSLFAPLYLLPLEANKKRTGRGAKASDVSYSFSYTGEDLVENVSLHEKLARDLQILLPKLNIKATLLQEQEKLATGQASVYTDAQITEILATVENDQVYDLLTYLDLVARTLSLAGVVYKIHDQAFISTFAFAKQRMYMDLNPEAWPVTSKLEDNQVINALFNEHTGLKEYQIGQVDDEYAIDEIANIHEKYPLLNEADSSQHSALIDVLKGKNLVIEGPPGSGKSQTITNIIAAAMKQGKKVLFVSEKMAALEVVYRRLSDMGLGDFCLEMHAPHSLKRRVIEALESRLASFKQYQPAANYQQAISNYEQLKTALNNYAYEINSEYGNTGFTKQQLLACAGYYKKYNFKNGGLGLFDPNLLADFNRSQAFFTKSHYEQVCRELASFTTVIAQVKQSVGLQQRYLTHISNQGDVTLNLLARASEQAYQAQHGFNTPGSYQLTTTERFRLAGETPKSATNPLAITQECNPLNAEDLQPVNLEIRLKDHLWYGINELQLSQLETHEIIAKLATWQQSLVAVKNFLQQLIDIVKTPEILATNDSSTSSSSKSAQVITDEQCATLVNSEFTAEPTGVASQTSDQQGGGLAFDALDQAIDIDFDFGKSSVDAQIDTFDFSAVPKPRSFFVQGMASTTSIATEQETIPTSSEASDPRFSWTKPLATSLEHTKETELLAHTEITNNNTDGTEATQTFVAQANLELAQLDLYSLELLAQNFSHLALHNLEPFLDVSLLQQLLQDDILAQQVQADLEVIDRNLHFNDPRLNQLLNFAFLEEVVKISQDPTVLIAHKPAILAHPNARIIAQKALDQLDFTQVTVSDQALLKAYSFSERKALLTNSLVAKLFRVVTVQLKFLQQHVAQVDKLASLEKLEQLLTIYQQRELENKRSAQQFMQVLSANIAGNVSLNYHSLIKLTEILEQLPTNLIKYRNKQLLNPMYQSYIDEIKQSLQQIAAEFQGLNLMVDIGYVHDYQDFIQLRNTLAVKPGFFALLFNTATGKAYKQAQARFKDICRGREYDKLASDRILARIESYFTRVEQFNHLTSFKEVFGELYQGIDTDVKPISELFAWSQKVSDFCRNDLNMSQLTPVILSQLSDTDFYTLVDLGQVIRTDFARLSQALQQINTCLKQPIKQYEKMTQFGQLALPATQLLRKVLKTDFTHVDLASMLQDGIDLFQQQQVLGSEEIILQSPHLTEKDLDQVAHYEMSLDQIHDALVYGQQVVHSNTNDPWAASLTVTSEMSLDVPDEPAPLSPELADELDQALAGQELTSNSSLQLMAQMEQSYQTNFYQATSGSATNTAHPNSTPTSTQYASNITAGVSSTASATATAVPTNHVSDNTTDASTPFWQAKPLNSKQQAQVTRLLEHKPYVVKLAINWYLAQQLRALANLVAQDTTQQSPELISILGDRQVATPTKEETLAIDVTCAALATNGSSFGQGFKQVLRLARHQQLELAPTNDLSQALLVLFSKFTSWQSLIAVQQHMSELSQYVQQARTSYEHFHALTHLDASAWLGTNRTNSLVDLIVRNQMALDCQDGLVEWLDYLHVKRKLFDLGIGQISYFAEQLKDLKEQMLHDLFSQIFFGYLAYKVISQSPILRDFSSLQHNALIAKFDQADIDLKLAQRQQAAFAIDQNAQLVPGYQSKRPAELTEQSLLSYLVKHKNMRASLRDILLRAGVSIQALKPCFMMSPASVAQYLTPGSLEFDLMVMDEASQVTPEDALGAIARCKQIVIVGDPKQLPPSNFFGRTSDLEGEDSDELSVTETAESILDVATTMFPTRVLRWHYRSQHESLIAFSNQQYYHSRLVIFPSPYANHPEYGIKYQYIPGSFHYKKANPQEAQVVAQAMAQHLKTYPHESLGVVAMNQRQAKLIEREFDKLVAADEELMNLYLADSDKLEPLFVKNLENVQGDERDVIMISCTYGPRKVGDDKVPQRFGPINGKAGGKRLNVLFTRSKKRMQVYSSMHYSDINYQDGVTDSGVNDFYTFLKFAETGVLGTTANQQQPMTVIASQDKYNYIVHALQQYLGQKYHVTRNIGVTGYKLDLGFASNDSSTYVLGLETDGQAYVQARSARDRDRLRSMVLSRLGWKLERLWTVDWFKYSNKEIITDLDYMLHQLVHGKD